MLRVIIELVPRGVESQKQKVAVIEIADDCTGDHNTGNYNIETECETVGGWDDLETMRLEGFDRTRGYLPLAAEALAIVAKPSAAELEAQAGEVKP